MYRYKNSQTGGNPFTLQQLQVRRSVLLPEACKGEPGHPVGVALVSAAPHLRHVIAQELICDPRVELICQADSVREGKRMRGIELVDVLLVGLSLHDGSGLDLVSHLKSQRQSATAIVITEADDDEQALRAFDIGVAGWLVLTSWFGSFVESVLQVANGGTVLTPGLARRLMRRPSGGAADPFPQPDAAVHLSDREREVLAMMADGLHSREIGKRLSISGETVNSHVKSIYIKLHVHNRAHAVRVASQACLL